MLELGFLDVDSGVEVVRGGGCDAVVEVHTGCALEHVVADNVGVGAVVG